jgi:hypothetical protein
MRSIGLVPRSFASLPLVPRYLVRQTAIRNFLCGGDVL